MIHVFFALVVLIAAFARRHRVFFYLAMLSLFAFAALRYRYGNDYAPYLRCYLEINDMGGDPFPGEWLYTALNRLSPHFFWLIAIASLAFTGAIGWLIGANVPRQDMWLSFALLLLNPYLFLMHLSAIRQSLALACFVLAVPFARKRRPLAYLQLMVAACGFHLSALLLAPLYLIANDRPVSRGCTLAAAALMLVLLCSGDALSGLVARLLALPGWERFRHVVNRGLRNSLRATLLSSVPLIYLLWNLPLLRGKALMYAKLWAVGSALAVLAFRLSLLTRVEMYFDLFSIAAFPLMLSQRRRENRLADLVDRRVFPALIALILALRYYAFFTNPMWESFRTYQTIFSAI